MVYNIKKYDNNLFEIWDSFIEISINGNIYHTKNFLSYHHNDKFIDESILIYKDNKLVCVVPCCKNGEKYFSHKGATYGGPVFSKEIFNIKNLKEIIDLILDYYDNKIEFRISNSIYYEISDDALLYLLGSKLKMYPELAWYIKTDNDIINSITNIRNKKNLINTMNDDNYVCKVFNEDIDYINFYKILNQNLNIRHESNPTHTIEEFLSLKKILGEKQKLYLVKNKEIIYGGVYVIKVTNICWYTFYISKNIDIKKNPSILYIMYTIQQDAKNENVKYIDFGITTEDRGKILNLGLADFKESSLSGKSSNRYLFLLD